MSETPAYTKDDLKQARRIQRLCESRDQMDRITGRLQWMSISKRLSKEAIEQLVNKLKD